MPSSRSDESDQCFVARSVSSVTASAVSFEPKTASTSTRFCAASASLSVSAVTQVLRRADDPPGGEEILGHPQIGPAERRRVWRASRPGPSS